MNVIANQNADYKTEFLIIYVWTVYLEFVFLPVDNDSSDLLIHEYQDGS